MCDEHSLADMRLAEMAARDAISVDRRGFVGASGAAALLVASTGTLAKQMAHHGADAAGGSLAEAMVSITTSEGTADGFFVHPARGRHAAILMWPDIAGLRDAYKAMARRLAGFGFAVLVVNQYYRTAPAPLVNSLLEFMTPDGSAKIKPAMDALTPEAAMSDARAFATWLDAQPQVDTRRGLGTCGYCMGGPLAVRSAAAVPARFKAVASLHGAALVTNADDSPHKLLAGTQARYDFAIARNDDARAPGDKDALKAAAAAAKRPAEISVYPADHGWCTLDAPSYNKVQAERALAQMVALFVRL